MSSAARRARMEALKNGNLSSDEDQDEDIYDEEEQDNFDDDYDDDAMDEFVIDDQGNCWNNNMFRIILDCNQHYNRYTQM